MPRKVSFILALLLLVASALAQGFGKNKVQYVEFDWRYIQSEHFDVYYSEGQERIAEFTAETAERALKLIEASWDYSLEGASSSLFMRRTIVSSRPMFRSQFRKSHSVDLPSFSRIASCFLILATTKHSGM